MEQNLHNHIKKDKAKWIVTGIAFMLIAVLFVGLCLQLFGTNNQKPSEWFGNKQCQHEYVDGVCSICGSEEEASNESVPRMQLRSLSSSAMLGHIAATSSNSNLPDSYTLVAEDTQTFNTCRDATRSADFGPRPLVGDDQSYASEWEFVFTSKNGKLEPFVGVISFGINIDTLFRFCYDYNSQYNDGEIGDNFGYIECIRSTGGSNYKTLYFDEPLTEDDGVFKIKISCWGNGGYISVSIGEEDNETKVALSGNYEEFVSELNYVVGKSFSRTSNNTRLSYLSYAIASEQYRDLLDEFSLKTTLKLYTSEMPLPANPIKEGHTFVGWYLDEALTQPYKNTPINENTSLFAKFDVNQYTVTFDCDGGADVAPQTVDWNTALTLSNPIRTGYTFMGWYLPDGTQYTNQPIREDTVLTAHWEIIRIRVTFFVDGAVYKEVMADYGTKLVEVANASNIYSQNFISYSSANLELLTGELKDVLVVDEIDVDINTPSKMDNALGVLKNNWISILCGCIGLIVVIAVISALVTRKKRYR